MSDKQKAQGWLWFIGIGTVLALLAQNGVFFILGFCVFFVQYRKYMIQYNAITPWQELKTFFFKKKNVKE